MYNKLHLSVVVLTKNEQANIKKCLESVYGWADEIIVVDDSSIDKTVEIASLYTKKILTSKLDLEGMRRNWAYLEAKNNWVLSLDADEWVSEELKEEISKSLEQAEFVAFSIPLRNYIGNYWVRYGGRYSAAKVRLFLKDKFKYEEVGVHPRAFIDGKCGHLKHDIIHKGYPDFEHFMNSINYQTTKEAQKWIDTGRKMTLIHAFWRTIDRFFRRFIGKRGYKDGFIGFMIAFCDSLYQILSYAKYRQLKNNIN